MNISVIGTGYVGLVSGTCFAEMGNHVICVDNNPEKIKKLKNGEITIYEPGLEVLFHRNIEKNRLEFTDSLKYAIEKTDLIFLCLPTPQGEDGSADMKYVFGVAKDIANIMKEKDHNFKILVNKSTVPVGTSKEVKKILDTEGMKNYDVVSNPEFLREGFAVEDFMKPDRVVVGAVNEKSFEIMRALYNPFLRQGNPLLEMDPESSEMTKYAANSYLAMRITYMNELANFCEKVGADVDMVRKGMGSDNRIGKRFLFPGIGYGGSCFPKDVNALIKTADENNYSMNILKIVDQVNKNQKLVIVNKLLEEFNNDLKDKKYAVWGLAFKPNTDDVREAPAIYIIREMLKQGAKINAYDPAAHETFKFYLGDEIEYCKDQYATLENCEALLILTEWNEFRNPNFDLIEKKLKNKIIFDGRNIFELKQMAELGYKYISIGRKKIG